jgi:signal transduction histidine kinase
MTLFRDIPIKIKLMRVILLTSGIMLLVTCSSFFACEFYTFRQTTIQKLSTLGEIISTNSTAALAFQDQESAQEILSALKAEPHIIAACLYDKDGKLFSYYPSTFDIKKLPAKAKLEAYHFDDNYLHGYQPVIQGSKQLGTLYLRSDLGAMYERFILYSIITALVIATSLLLAYFLSQILQKSIATPILALAETAKAISTHGDYSVRAIKLGKDELGSLTDAFNHMIIQIHNQNQTLSEFNQTLEQKVKDRTLELETVNKELDSFSYSVSHDLRAPIRSINNYINILLEDYVDQMDGEAKRLIQIVIKNSQKMGTLIDDLLAFSKLGRKDLTKVSLSMKSLVEDIWKENFQLEPHRNIEFKLDELPDCYAEKATIQQVWVNLISNALKYTRKKEKTIIEITWEEKEKEIIYSIKDNGIGFDMNYYDKLFGVFQRLHSPEEFEGTGVGLAIVQRIIEKHGGKIWASSQPNIGTTFYFSLPKKQV